MIVSTYTLRIRMDGRLCRALQRRRIRRSLRCLREGKKSTYNLDNLPVFRQPYDSASSSSHKRKASRKGKLKADSGKGKVKDSVGDSIGWEWDDGMKVK